MRTDLRSLLVTCSFVLAGGSASTQIVPLAVTSDGVSHQVIAFSLEDGAILDTLAGLEFLDIALAGAPQRDRLRLDLPRMVAGEPGPAHVVLPWGGTLFRVRQGVATAVLAIDASGVPSLLASTPAAGGSPALRAELAVSSDGAVILAATEPAAGGDVLRIDLGTGAVTTLTASLPPLDVEATSLRVSPSGAFFVASDRLYRAPTGSLASEVVLGSGGLALRPDTVLNAGGTRLAIVAGSEDIELADRRLFVVDLSGTWTEITSTPTAVDEAGHEHPLGPFLALSDDGSQVAYRVQLDTHELFVRDVDLPQPSVHLTEAEFFPAYIDNVGILGFKPGPVRALQFFAGDVTISGVDAQEMIGAADLYVAELPLDAPPTFVSLSATSGQSAPPYDAPGTLQFSEAVLDPFGQRFLLVGEDPVGSQTLTTVNLLEGPYAGTTELIVGDLDEDPLLVPAGPAVLVRSHFEVELSGGVELNLVGLDLLPSLHGDATSALVPIGLLPDDFVIDRFAAARGGQHAAFVVSLGAGLEIPFFVATTSGLALPAFLAWFNVSPGMAFSSAGELIAGLGGASGPAKFARFPEPGVGTLLELPVGWGFPLPY